MADKISHEAVKTPILGDIPIFGALFRHTSDSKEKTDLVLVLTPYIIRDQEDMRRIVERRMEERQELLDHQALFSDRPWHSPETFARASGILTAMRRSARELEVERERAEALLPRPAKTHEPTAPLDLPATPSPQVPAASPAATPEKGGGAIVKVEP